jgi:AcrR family transcriptional regulator
LVTGASRAERSAARRQEILSASARLFRQRGFVAVGVDDIGAAVGVSGPAVYRHFRSKQDLLAEVILNFLDGVRSQLALAETDTTHGPTANTVDDPLWAALIPVALRDPDGFVVMLRHSSGLQELELERVRSAYKELFGAWDGSLLDGTGSESDLRLRSACGALVSVSFAKVSARTQREDLAKQLVHSVMQAPLPKRETPEDSASLKEGLGLSHVSRREAILATATQLFRAGSYDGVSLKDIGDQIGVTPSAIRRHFSSKEQLLAAMFNRAAEQVAAGIAGVLRDSSTPEEAIVGMLRKYSQLALDSSDLIYIYVTEMYSLPVGQLRTRRRKQRIYIGELKHLRTMVEPKLSSDECWLRARAAYSAINEAVLDDQLCLRPNLSEELTALSISVIALES